MKKALIAVAILAIIGGIVGYKMYNKPHENIEKASADFSITATALNDEYGADEGAADTKYLDKTVEVSGEVSEVSKDDEGIVNVILESGGMFGVTCKLDHLTEHKRTEFKIGEKVKLKGKLTGSLMGAVLLVRCVEVD